MEYLESPDRSWISLCYIALNDDKEVPMSATPNVQFGDPEQVVTRFARIALDRGLIHISVTGPAPLVEAYVQEAQITVDLQAPDAFGEFIPMDDLPQEQRNLPGDEGQLRIVIDVVEAVDELFTLQIDVDPATVKPNQQHVYEILRAREVKVGIVNKGNDPDLHLSIWDGAQWDARKDGIEQPVGWPLGAANPTLTVDEWLTDTTEPTPSRWELRVHGQNAEGCSYDLYGAFRGQPYRRRSL
jgi:hypothetical protein